MLGSKESIDDLWEIATNEEKLKSYEGFKKMMALGVAKKMAFHHDLPYQEIKGFVEEERKLIFDKISDEAMKEGNIVWEHVGSTSIKGMPGTQFPDALLAYDTFPPPKEAFVALLESGFTFIGSGPFGTQDIWFLKPISREGSILHEALFKVHFTPKDLGSTKLLLETRDRCNNNSEDFLDYKEAKVEAAKHFADGNIMAYKTAKGKSKLLAELTAKHGCTVPT